MKILLDECVPVQVRRALHGHEVVSVGELQWKGRQNGDLLSAAETAGFEVLLLADKNLRYQQNLAQRKIAIVELWTNHRPTLERHLPYIASFVASAIAGSYIVIPAPPVA
jgi:hypothetical protein